VGEKDEDTSEKPLFVTEFLLEPMRLLFTPDEDEFQEAITEIIAEFQRVSLDNENLVADSYFNAFTRSANGTYPQKNP